MKALNINKDIVDALLYSEKEDEELKKLLSEKGFDEKTILKIMSFEITYDEALKKLQGIN